MEDDDIFVTSEESADESAVGARARDGGPASGKADMLKAWAPSRCHDLLETAPPPKDGIECDTDESTTIANSSLAEKRRTRRAGKRARGRPCHRRGKEGAQAPSQSQGAAQEEGEPAGSEPAQVEQWSFYTLGTIPKNKATTILSASSGRSGARPLEPEASEHSGPSIIQEVDAESADLSPDPLVGKRALLKGLVLMPEFNGEWGKIESYDAESMRYVVKVARNRVTPVLTKVRRENLVIPPPLELKFGDGKSGAAEAASARRPRCAAEASAASWRPSLRL